MASSRGLNSQGKDPDHGACCHQTQGSQTHIQETILSNTMMDLFMYTYGLCLKYITYGIFIMWQVHFMQEIFLLHRRQKMKVVL